MERRSFVKAIISGAAAAGFAPRLRADTPVDLQALAVELRQASGEEIWERVRKQFSLERGLAHLNTGSVGATPRPVIDTVVAAMREMELNPQRVM